jgi:diaminopimelate decarboxylase
VSQFGLDEAEAAEVLRLLRRRRREPESVHFHAGTQIDSARTHLDALQEVARRCARLGFRPRYVDCGGGLPAPHTLDGKGRRIDRRYLLPQLGRGLAAARRWFPDLVAYWLENGRFVTAGSGVLVVSVLDCKQRGGQRYLICDGGRTNQALLSQWEAHACLPVRPRRAASTPCVVTGPTCMAFDVLAEQPLPTTLRAGDALMWMDAGAYAIPWENRFSHGLAGVLWHQDDQLTLARHPEGFAAFWQNWNGPAGAQRSLAAAAASKAK